VKALLQSTASYYPERYADYSNILGSGL